MTVYTGEFMEFGSSTQFVKSNQFTFAICSLGTDTFFSLLNAPSIQQTIIPVKERKMIIS